MQYKIEELKVEFSAVENVVVLGNSGSLLETPKQSEWRIGEDVGLLTIGVNRILRQGLDGRMYFPDVIVISDAKVLASDGDRLKESQEWPNRSPHLVVASWLIEEMDKLDVDYAVQQCYYVNRSEYGGEELQDRIAQEILPLAIGDPLSTIANVFFWALQLGCVIARDKVLLLGAEGRWPGPHDSRRASHHFYDDNDLQVTENRAEDLKPEYVRHWQRLRDFYMQYKPGLRIHDLSAWYDISTMGFVQGEVGELLFP